MEHSILTSHPTRRSQGVGMADRNTELEARTGLTSTPFSLLERATRDQRISRMHLAAMPVTARLALCAKGFGPQTCQVST
jgi:hypothetical protein